MGLLSANKGWPWLRGLVVAISLLVLAVVGLPQASAADLRQRIVVVMSANSGVGNIDSGTLRNIFRGVSVNMRKGETFIPLNHEARSLLRVEFDRQFLGMDEAAASRYWIDQRIRARARPPRTIESLDTLRRVVAALPRAISYVRAEDLQPGIVPLKVDGVDFRSPKYPYQLTRQAALQVESEQQEGTSAKALRLFSWL